MNQALLQLHNLSCERDERLLFHRLNATIDAGDIVQIEGPNGSGKTTLLRVLTSISNDYQGDILWQGQPLSRVKLDYLSQLLHIGHLPGVKKALTPRENLTWYAGMNNTHPSRSNNNERIEQALSEVGLFGYEDTPCFQLSAGQARRVALARLFFTPARVWILDEPFTAIDHSGIENLQRVMTEHVAGGGCVILTTHQEMNLANVKRINLLDNRPSAEDLEARESMPNDYEGGMV